MTAVHSSRNATKKISRMWTRTVVPNHRPKLRGDQVKGSFMAGHPVWVSSTQPRTLVS